MGTDANRTISGDYESDVTQLKKLLHFPENCDAVFREIRCADFRICAVLIDGMADNVRVEDFVLRAAQQRHEAIPIENRVERLLEQTVSVAQAKTAVEIQEILSSVLSGMAALIVEGADAAIVMDVRGFACRKVDKPTNESVVFGAKEGFVENLRANLTLIHRYLQTPDLVTELLSVGEEAPLRVAILHVEGVTNADALALVRKRLSDIRVPSVRGAGQLQQLIEDDSMAIAPQMLMTERPDRAASALADGQFVLVADGSPCVLAAPCCLFTLLQASDDAFARWQYGTYMRIVRFVGMLLTVFLPGTYVALTTYHTHLIPMELLSSIAETRVNVPFPVLFEVLVMELAFFMINEANLRIPSQVGSSIGIIGALVLGQAAAEASVISPILIIIIAISGLGCYCMPDYSMTVALILCRLLIVVSAAALGLYGIALGLVLILGRLCAMESFGVPFLAPIAPKRPHNPDFLVRFPIFFQKKPLFFSRKAQSGRRATG